MAKEPGLGVLRRCGDFLRGRHLDLNQMVLTFHGQNLRTS